MTNAERFSTNPLKKKIPRFGHVSGDFDPEIRVGPLNPKTLESEEQGELR